MKTRSLLAALSAGVLAFGVAACGDDDDDSAGGAAATTQPATTPQEEQSSGTDYASLTGSIRIDGSSTVQPIAEAASELLGDEASGLRITVGGAGTGDGFERFCRGEIQIADASRRMEADEVETCAAQNIEPVEVEVAIDGLSVIVHPGLEIPNNCLTTDQLKELLAPGSKVANWSELGEGFPDQRASFFTPGTESGTYDYFTEAALETDAEQRTQNVQTSADDNQIITGIAGTEGALGYVGYAFADENKDKVKTVQVDGGDGCVEPNAQTIADNSYAPLSRTLFMYPSMESIATPAVKGYLSYLTENSTEIVEAADYIPLPEDRLAAAKAAIDAPKALTAADLENAS